MIGGMLAGHDEGEEKSINADPEETRSAEEDRSVKITRRRPRRRSLYHWELPSPDLLESTTGQAVGGDTERNKHIIQNTLKYFGIQVEPGEVRVGPTVTQYTFRPAFGVKLSRITALSNDLALALAAQSIRIEAPIPGQSLIGIEVPNKSVQPGYSRARNSRTENQSTLVLRQDVANTYVLANLRKMPHLLIAGRTGSGKSVCINTLLLSLLYQNSPEDLKLILVDPKRVELSSYKGIPHLKTDVIVDNKKVVNVLKWAVSEMERRYKLLEEVHARDLLGYREKCAQGEMKTVVDAESGEEKPAGIISHHRD
jgi:S-DNA-T family DNA segregation ATPase FtsK/SpoIIIE